MNHRRPCTLMIVFVFLLCAFCLLPTALAQSATATLSGTVEDQQGAIIPEARITVVNDNTRSQRQTTTNDRGDFTVPLLPPSTYTVSVERQGFAPVQINNVVLNVGDQKSLQIQLKPGNISEMVQVVGDAALINTSPAVATTIDRTFVGNLPLNGRSFQSLILLTPGVTVSSSTPLSDTGQFSVNGQRASTNYFTVDGVSANVGMSPVLGATTNLAIAGAYPGTSAFGSTTNLVSVDALEEFKIQTSSYTAESGRQPGGQVQLVTRSGTSSFHGTLFEYFRNDALDARDYFNKKPEPQAALRQNQFGGTFSGPLPFFNFGEGGPLFITGRDRTFFFISYEGLRLRLPTSGVQNVPSLRVRQISAPAVQSVLNALPLPSEPELLNAAGLPTGWARFNYSISNPSELDASSIRIDHRLSSRLTLFGRFNESPSDTTTGIAGKTTMIAATRTFTWGSTWVLSSKLINDIRFNWSRQRAKQESSNIALGGAVPIDSTILTSGYNDFGRITFLYGGFVNSVAGGRITDSFQRQINIVNNLSYIRDQHQFKFGLDYRRLAPIYGPADQQGARFSSETAVRNGTLNLLEIFTIRSARPQFDNFSAYIQDTWKASRRLTLDLGVRWELNPPPTEAEGQMPPLAIGIVGTDVRGATLAPRGTPFFKTSYTAFAPRFGAAYLLKNTAGRETVLRGGFGVYYDLGNGTASGGWPLMASRTQSNVPFPVPAALAIRPGVVPTTLPTTNTVISLDPNLKLPYILQWNFAIEQSLGTQQTVSLSYVAAVGRRLLTIQQLNPPAGLSSGPRPNPNFGTIRYSSNGARADYHSLQSQYKARLSRGIQALFNYTWSHAIDEVSSDIQTGVLERGNANFDVRHNFSAALHYDIPPIKAGSFLGTVFRRLSLSAIAHAQSGLPIDVVGSQTVIDSILLRLRPDLVSDVPIYLSDPTVPGGRRFNSAAFRAAPANPLFPGVPARQGNLGRNVLRELPLYQVDVSFGRKISLTEKLTLQAKADIFNVLNHPMFGGYSANFTVPSTFGVPSLTLSRSLGGLSSLNQLGGPRSIQLSLRLSF
ncbi:MAG TPA: TonB-dependent receptor [Pyrinomonadaceae bacterium]|nr:TonB-dependent receptor [Pyrinomonadaceae bacterium]